MKNPKHLIVNLVDEIFVLFKITIALFSFFLMASHIKKIWPLTIDYHKFDYNTDYHKIGLLSVKIGLLVLPLQITVKNSEKKFFPVFGKFPFKQVVIGYIWTAKCEFIHFLLYEFMTGSSQARISQLL